jgi:ElaB/YqjD/DUF883 family membrane-anchored ribosome-binding protein
MVRELKAVTARLEALEKMPALATTPAAQAAALRGELHQAGEEARRGLAHSQAQLDGAVRALHGLIRSANEWRDQKQWLWMVGGIGVMLGVLLWFLLPLVLPWGAGDWLSALPLGGGPWQAGASLMQRADPVTWERMIRLYRACPPERATEWGLQPLFRGNLERALSRSDRAKGGRPKPRRPGRFARSLASLMSA